MGQDAGMKGKHKKIFTLENSAKHETDGTLPLQNNIHYSNDFSEGVVAAVAESNFENLPETKGINSKVEKYKHDSSTHNINEIAESSASMSE
jgi:hypothetical protein